MAKFTGKTDSDGVIHAAGIWRSRCLSSAQSVLTERSLWNAETFEQLKIAFVDNPLSGPQPFIEKLVSQLEPARPEVQQLAAECLWLLFLFVGKDQFSEKLKRERIATIWTLSGQSLPDRDVLSDRALSGLAKPGAAFLTKIPSELEYLVRTMIAWCDLVPAEKSRLLENAWDLSDWLATLPGSDRRAFRHMFLYFCFPEKFERICSWTHKRKILKAFSPPELEVDKLDVTGIDKTLFELRQRLEVEHGTLELDFYIPPLREVWLKAPELSDDVDDGLSTQTVWIEKTIVKDRLDRLQGDDALGRALWSPQRSKAGGDIYSNMRRVRAGDIILHLTDNRAITHVSTASGEADPDFVGPDGTDWAGLPAYRIPLRDTVELDPPLKREDFLEKEPFSSQLRSTMSGTKGLFFNTELTLNQGAYLTEAPAWLLYILDGAYRGVAGRGLPMLDLDPAAIPPAPQADEFDADEVAADLFLEDDEVQSILTLWLAKKNIILTGPPGVGKSFAAQRLAYLLMGAKARDRLALVQFHQSYAYEDFVQGYRPTGDGGFHLRNGKFVEFCKVAAADPGQRYVFIIDEINRGNLSKILGELMLLIESDKRDERWEMTLAYSSEPFHVPDNVHLIGLMNTADRSLAVVDYALRRRFAFIEMSPRLDSEKFRQTLLANGVDEVVVNLVQERIEPLNLAIVEDTSNLGPGFAIGHSFFCSGPSANEDSFSWYSRIVRNELIPLLREYWFDAPDKPRDWEDRLLAELQ